jgi:ATP-dependent DNA helicase RecG
MKLKLIRNGKLTNAAIILFGKKPKKFFNNAIVKCGRFRGTGKEFIDMKDFEGNLFDALDKILSFFKEHLRVSARIEGIIRKEKLEIPLEALREAVINALIHRDYFDTGFTYIKIHDDKVIIANPGNLPEKISIKDLFKEHESKPRNPLLASTFYYTGLIDAWGHGIQNIITALKKENLPLPEFEQSAGSFRIISQRRKRDEIEEVGEKDLEKDLEKITTNQKRIFFEIRKNKHITNKELSAIVGINEKNIRNNISKLKKKGLLKRIGPDKGGCWKVLRQRLTP